MKTYTPPGPEPSREWLRHHKPWMLEALVLTLLSGCGAIPIKSEKIEQTDSYVAKATLEPLVVERLSRRDVVAKFGQPTRYLEYDRGAGYIRCVSFEGRIVGVVFFVPVPPAGKAPVTDCEFIGFWFDESDRLIKADTHITHGEMLQSDSGDPLTWEQAVSSGSTWVDHAYGELENWLRNQKP